MSDLPTTPPPAVPGVAINTGVSGLPSLSAAQVASMREAWLAAGHDIARFDAALSPNAQHVGGQGSARITDSTPGALPRDQAGRFTVPPDPTSRSGDAAPSAVQLLGNTKTPPVTSAQAADLAEALLKAGVDPARVREAMAEHGVVEDTRSDEEQAHDVSWGFDQHYEPGDYTGIEYPRGTDPAALVEFNTAATGWLAAMQAQPLEGKFIVERGMEIGRELRGMDDAQRATWVAKQRYDLEQRLGPDAFKETLRLAAYALRMGRDQPFYENLRQSHALDDPFIVRTLANVGRRIEGWTKGRSK